MNRSRQYCVPHARYLSECLVITPREQEVAKVLYCSQDAARPYNAGDLNKHGYCQQGQQSRHLWRDERNRVWLCTT